MADPPAQATPDWAPCSTLLLGWPTRPDTWRLGGAPARAALLDFATLVLSRTAALRVVVVEDDAVAPALSARAALSALAAPLRARAAVLRVPLDDCWLRDTGPVMLRAGRAAVFRFNAWGGADGGCYASFARDARAGARLARALRLRARVADMVLEGGAVCADGAGTLLATEQCLLHRNRNAGWSRGRVEGALADALAARKVVWLPDGAAFDAETDGHVDNIAAFVAPAHVLLLWASPEGCPEQHRRSAAALRSLRCATDAAGAPLRVSTVTAPSPVVRTREEAEGVVAADGVRARPEGERVCASYVNFVVAEGVVFVPAFGDDESDCRARREMEATFEEYGRKVVMVQAREFVLAGGGLHCLSVGVPQVDGDSPPWPPE